MLPICINIAYSQKYPHFYIEKLESVKKVILKFLTLEMEC